jgi:SNF2 family DNA or RNA helicase
MGGGKTVMAATAMQELLREGAIERVLIFCPKRVGLMVWPAEMQKWDHLDLGVAVAIGSEKQRHNAILSDAPVVVINFENMVWFFDNYPSHNFDCLVIDELSKMKSAQSKRHKALRRHVYDFTVRWGLTGTPTSNSVVDLFGQMFCIDCGDRLGKTFSAFRREYMVWVGPNQWDWELRPKAFEAITDKIKDIAFLIENKDYVDQLPRLVKNRIQAPMPAAAAKVYEELEETFVASLTDGEIVDAASAGVLVNKLAQVADGFLYMDEGYQWLHDAKIDALEEIIEEQQGAPLLVAYRYRAELLELQKKWPAPYLGAGVTDKQSEKNVRDWNAGRLPLLYLHPASAGHGLNLQAGGNVIAWYGHTWSREEHDQTIARLRRTGQERDQVWSHYIISAPIDLDVLEAVRVKQNIAKKVAERLK